MQVLTEMRLPELPAEQPDFGTDPMRHFEDVREKHSWLAKFSQGYVIHGYQATKDMFAMDDKMSAGFASLVEFYGAHGTPWGRFMEEMLLSRSGAEHARLRQSVAAAFTPRAANNTRILMRKIMSDLLDEWAPAGEFDFAVFASYFPVAVMFGLLGVSGAHIPKIRDALETQMASLTLNRDLLPAITDAYALISEFADDLIAERERVGPKGDGGLLDALISAKNAGGLDETELKFMLMVLLFAGYDTSKNMLGVTVHTLLQYPAYWAKCAEDKAFCAKVVEETLRYSAPTTPYRQVDADFVYENVLFPKGTMLIFPTFYTGRDPSAFSDPLKFDPERVHSNRHVAFGRGAHICLGMHIARTQIEEGLHIICQRLTNARVGGQVTWRPFLGVWGPSSLPIAFEYAARTDGAKNELMASSLGSQGAAKVT